MRARLVHDRNEPQSGPGSATIARMTRALLICASVSVWLVVATAGAQNAPVTAFVGATIVDGTGAAPVPKGVVLVSGGRITAAGPSDRVAVPSGARRVDLAGKTLLPGFVNAHGHLAGTRRDEYAAQLLLYARYGVTSVFSLGGEGTEAVPLRDGPARGRARLFIAGPVVAGTSAAAVADEVASNAAMTVDWLKIRIDDNLGTAAKTPAEAWKAAIQRGHERGLPVAVHIFYLEDAKAALREGVDLIAHSVRDLAVDAELIRLARARDVCVSPTLMREVSTFVYESSPAFFSDQFFLRHADKAVITELSSPARQQEVRSSKSAQRYKVALEQASRNVKQLHDAGVRIAMGTDTGANAGRFQGYFEHMELEMMVKAGLTPMQAIVAATGDAARCMKKAGVIGTIQSGAFADLVVYGADPSADIRNSRSIEAVFVAGERVP
jgi:imidazolonepropionase-like amidohydrolase